MKGFITFFFFLLLPPYLFAETCPTITQLKSHSQHKGWMIYDVEDGKLLSQKREKKFLQAIQAFTLAESIDKPGLKKHSVRCYYRDAAGSDQEAFVSNEHYKPKQSNYWYQVSGFKHCAAGMKHCEFIRA